MHGPGVVEKCTQTRNYLSQNCTFVFSKMQTAFPHSQTFSNDVVNSQKNHSNIWRIVDTGAKKKSQAHKLHIICWFAVWIEQIALRKSEERVAVDDGRLMMYEGLTSIDIPLSTGLSSARSNPIDFLFGYRCKLWWERENSPLLPNKPPHFDSISLCRCSYFIWSRASW